MIGRPRRFAPDGKGGVSDWDDTTIAGDFVDQIETEVLPLLRSLDSIARISTFIFSQKMMGYTFTNDHIRISFTNATLGGFAIAKKHWDLITPSFEARAEKQAMTDGGIICDYLRSGIAVGEALQAGDHMALAKLLWENERSEADRFKLGRHWQPTAFPFQKAATPTPVADMPDQL
jgi:hypothetical protein